MTGCARPANVHDAPSLARFYAMRHENNMKGLAFMEAIMEPCSPWQENPGE
jgi:hypothetical protein